MTGCGKCALGTGLCLSVAVVFIGALHGSRLEGVLPFLFLSIVIVIALRFGSIAGILGTLGAAVIFAEFLFEPLWSIRIGDAVQRSNLIWMVVVGVAISELLGARPNNSQRRES
jgi:K+-sensing histidine kinase KdpD